MANPQLKSYEEWAKDAPNASRAAYDKYKQWFSNAVLTGQEFTPGGDMTWVGSPQVTQYGNSLPGMLGNKPQTPTTSYQQGGGFGGGGGMGGKYGPSLAPMGTPDPRNVIGVNPQPILGGGSGSGSSSWLQGLMGGIKGAAGKAGDWLGDNILDLAGPAAMFYGAYQQGKGQDRQLDMAQEQIAEEQRRHEDERARKSNAAGATLPMVQGIKDQLDEELRRAARGPYSV
jgi:hypothetical protein